MRIHLYSWHVKLDKLQDVRLTCTHLWIVVVGSVRECILLSILLPKICLDGIKRPHQILGIELGLILGQEWAERKARPFSGGSASRKPVESTKPSKTRRRSLSKKKKKEKRKERKTLVVTSSLSASRLPDASNPGSQRLGEEEQHGTAAVARNALITSQFIPPNPISKRPRRRSPIVRTGVPVGHPSIDPNLQVAKQYLSLWNSDDIEILINQHYKVLLPGKAVFVSLEQ